MSSLDVWGSSYVKNYVEMGVSNSNGMNIYIYIYTLIWHCLPRIHYSLRQAFKGGFLSAPMMVLMAAIGMNIYGRRTLALYFHVCIVLDK